MTFAISKVPNVILVLTPASGTPFVFTDTEVPEAITVGGGQNLKVHELVGGGRVVDALGSQPGPISWSGLALGPTAEGRMLFLDAMRKSGKALVFTFGTYRYSVVIRFFRPVMLRSYHYHYSIDLEVVQDLRTTTPTLPVSADKAITVDLGAATNSLPTATAVPADLRPALADVSVKLSAATVARNAISKFASATTAQIKAFTGPINDALSTVQGLVSQLNLAVQNVTTAGGLTTGGTPLGNVLAAEGLSSNLASLSSLHVVSGCLGRILKNTGTAPNGQTIIHVAGGDLMLIATQQYGDPMLWTAIAKANGMSDPRIVGARTLVIPPNPQNTGGVLNG